MISFKDGRIATSILISADTKRVWKIIIDTMLWPQWGPSVLVVECADRYINAQSQGRLKTALGIWLPFTITEFEAFHFWSWRIGRIEATGHRVSQRGQNQTVLSFTMPWWSAPYLVICKRALQNIDDLAMAPVPAETRQ